MLDQFVIDPGTMNITEDNSSRLMNLKSKKNSKENTLTISQTLKQLKDYNHFHGGGIKRNFSAQPKRLKKNGNRESSESYSPIRDKRCSHNHSGLDSSPNALIPNRHRICCSGSKNPRKSSKKDFASGALQKHRAARTIMKLLKRWKKRKIREYFSILRDFGLFCTISEDSAREAVMSRSEYKEMFEEGIEEKFQEERKKLFEVHYMEDHENYGVFVQDEESEFVKESDFSPEMQESEEEEEEVNLLEDSVSIEEIEDFDQKIEEEESFQDERLQELVKLKNEMVGRGLGKLRLFFLDAQYDSKARNFYYFFEKLKILNFFKKFSTSGRNLNIVDYGVNSTFLETILTNYEEESNFKNVFSKLANNPSEQKVINFLKRLLLPLSLKKIFKKNQQKYFKSLSKKIHLVVRRVNTSPQRQVSSKNLSSLISSNNTKMIMMFSKKSPELRQNSKNSISSYEAESVEFRKCEQYIRQHRDKRRKNALVFLVMKLEKSQNLKIYKVFHRLRNFSKARKTQRALKKVRRGVFFLTIIEKIKNLKLGFGKLRSWNEFAKKSGGYFGNNFTYSTETILMQDEYYLKRKKDRGVRKKVKEKRVWKKSKSKKRNKVKKVSKRVQTMLSREASVLRGEELESRASVFTSKFDRKSHKNLIKIFKNRKIQSQFGKFGSPVQYKTYSPEKREKIYNMKDFNLKTEFEDYQQRKQSMIEELKKNSEEYYLRKVSNGFGDSKCICGNFDIDKTDFESRQQSYHEYLNKGKREYHDNDNLLCIFCLQKKLKNQRKSRKKIKLDRRRFLKAESSPLSEISTEIIKFEKGDYHIEDSINPQFLESENCRIDDSLAQQDSLTNDQKFQYNSNPVNFSNVGRREEINNFCNQYYSKKNSGKEKFIKVEKNEEEDKLRKFYLKDTISVRQALDRRKSNSRKRRERARSYAEYMEDGKNHNSTRRKNSKSPQVKFDKTIEKWKTFDLKQRRASHHVNRRQIPETLNPEFSYKRKQRKSRDRLLNKNIDSPGHIRCQQKCTSCIFHETYFKKKMKKFPHTLEENLKSELCLKCGNKYLIHRDIKLISEKINNSGKKKNQIQNFNRRKSHQLKKNKTSKRQLFRTRNKKKNSDFGRLMGYNVHQKFQEFEDKLTGLIKDYNLGPSAKDYQFRRFKLA